MEGTCKNNIGWVTCRDLLVSLWPCEAFPGWIKIPELNRHWKGGGVIIEMSDVEWIIFPTCACCFTSPKSYFLFFLSQLICQSQKIQPAVRCLGCILCYLVQEAKITGYSSLSAGYCALLTLPWHTKVTRQVEQDEVDGGDSPFWNGEQQC